MTFLTQKLLKPLKHGGIFIGLVLSGIVIGVSGGILGSVFHLSVDEVTKLRFTNSWLILLLPAGGVIITFFYRIFKNCGPLNTDRVLLSARGSGNIPLVMVPLIFTSSVISHLLGASVGREGAALQLGGGLGYNLGKLFRRDGKTISVFVMAGMSAVFSALFGTPVTAAFFAIEVASTGIMSYGALISCMVASLCAFKTALFFGISPINFTVALPADLQILTIARVVVLASLCAIVSILFCHALHATEKLSGKLFTNPYLRGAAGGILIVLLTIVIGSSKYNGAGMDVIADAMGGKASPEAFALKILFTVISVCAGFKGGEIVPTFFIGSTFGCYVGGILGLDPTFGAAIGMITLFCGVVNCPVASFILAIEVFGGSSSLFFAIAIAIVFMLSGKCSLYKEQLTLK